MAKELLVYRLNTIHNLHYYAKLMTDIGRAIGEGKLPEFRREFYERQNDEKITKRRIKATQIHNREVSE